MDEYTVTYIIFLLALQNLLLAFLINSSSDKVIQEYYLTYAFATVLKRVGTFSTP